MWTAIYGIYFVFILNYSFLLFKMSLEFCLLSCSISKHNKCLSLEQFLQTQIALLTEQLNSMLYACTSLCCIYLNWNHKNMKHRTQQGWKANKRPKSATIIEQPPWWRVIHMKGICGRANVECASISKRGELGSRKSLVWCSPDRISMPASPIRYRMVSMYWELEHPQVITFHIRRCGSVRKMSPIHLAYEMWEWV